MGSLHRDSITARNCFRRIQNFLLRFAKRKPLSPNSKFGTAMPRFSNEQIKQVVMEVVATASGQSVHALPLNERVRGDLGLDKDKILGTIESRIGMTVLDGLHYRGDCTIQQIIDVYARKRCAS